MSDVELTPNAHDIPLPTPPKKGRAVKVFRTTEKGRKAMEEVRAVFVSVPKRIPRAMTLLLDETAAPIRTAEEGLTFRYVYEGSSKWEGGIWLSIEEAQKEVDRTVHMGDEFVCDFCHGPATARPGGWYQIFAEGDGPDKGREMNFCGPCGSGVL